MIKFFIFLSILASNVFAYVPTVESLFRNGSNPDIIGNGFVINFSVRKIQPGEISPTTPEDYYKIFMTKGQGDSLKVSQTKYTDSTYSEDSLVHKIHYNQFTAHTMKATQEQIEKGIFFALLHSMGLNNGSHMVNYLKSLGIPVRLNNEIINRQKIDVLANYKNYLASINRDRNARKTEINPLKPEDPGARGRVTQIMDESMYVDTKHVKLGKDENDMVWLVNAGSFEAVISYQKREVQKVRYKSAAGEFEIISRNFWLANGTHVLPRFIMIKNFNGESFQVEIKNLRHYTEKEDDVAKRVSKWEQILKSKDMTVERPEFLL